MVEQNGGKFRRLEIIKKTLLLVGIKTFFGRNEKIFYRETLLPYV